MMQLSEHSFKKFLIALALYLTSLLAANTLGLKIMPFIFGSHLSVAVFSFPALSPNDHSQPLILIQNKFKNDIIKVGFIN